VPPIDLPAPIPFPLPSEIVPPLIIPDILPRSLPQNPAESLSEPTQVREGMAGCLQVLLGSEDPRPARKGRLSRNGPDAKRLHIGTGVRELWRRGVDCLTVQEARNVCP
jgi:hypothetical protein